MKVVRSLPVPIFEDDRLAIAAEKSPTEISSVWTKVLEFLRKYLERYKNYVKQDKPLTEPDEIFTLIDLIHIFFKAPLYREALSDVYASPYKKLLLYKLFSLKLGDKNAWELLNPEIGERKILEYLKADENLRDIMFILESSELLKALEFSYLYIPADTRPGYNYSSFIVHLMLCSAFAWALARKSFLEEKRQAIIVLAAMLHDIGKPINFKDHVTESVKAARKVLYGLVDDETLEEVIKLIEGHHRRISYGEIDEAEVVLRKADSLSAGYDRLKKIVDEVLKNDLEKEIKKLGVEGDFETAYSTGRVAWRIWEELERRKTGTIKALSEKFIKKLKEYKAENEKDIYGSDIYLLKADVRQIQSYVYSTGLIPAIMFSSVMVDFYVITLIPAFLWSRYKIPFASFVYNGGGNVLLIVPGNLVEAIGETLEKTSRSYKYLRLPRISYAYVPMPLEAHGATPGEIFDLLERKLSFAKSEISENYPKSISLGIEYKCELCGVNPASTRVRDRFKACKDCKLKVEDYGVNINFMAKWQNYTLNGKTLKEVTGYEFEAVSEKIMEFLAGMSLNEEEKVIKTPNIAVLKIDGNLIGSFMAESKTFNELIEKSYRIDLSLKKAWFKFIKLVKDSLGANGILEALRASLGLIYLGGDDALIILPAWLSIPASLTISYVFHREMGGSCSLSIGLASAPPKHPLYVLINAADKLLEYAKDLGRRLGKDAIAFIYTEGGTLTPGTAVSILRKRKNENISNQPYIIRSSDGFLKILNTLLDLKLSNENICEETLKELISKCYSIRQEDKNIENIYKVAKEMLQKINFRSRAVGFDFAILETVAYLFRQAVSRTKYRSAYERLAKNSIKIDSYEIKTVFFDIALAYKLLSGGFR